MEIIQLEKIFWQNELKNQKAKYSSFLTPQSTFYDITLLTASNVNETTEHDLTLKNNFGKNL